MANKHHMDPNKSGVIIFFEPMLEEVDDLDAARLGQLFRAILHFAAGGGDPVFEDETLRHIWRFVRALIIRDDKNYTKKVAGKQYGVYCRFAKEHHYTPLSREDWDELGGPTFKEWEKTLNAQTHTNVCDVCVCMPTSDSSSHSFSSSTSSSTSSSSSPSTSASASATAEPPDGGANAADTANANADTTDAAAQRQCNESDDKAPPYEIPTLAQVESYCQRKNLTYTNPAEYYDYYAANGWMVGVNGGNPSRIVDWKAHIRRWDAGNRKRAAGAASNGRGGASDAVFRDLSRQFREEDSVDVAFRDLSRQFKEEDGT